MQKDIIRAAFSQRAESYADAAITANPERHQRLIDLISPPPEAHALDVATGQGFLAMALARVCREVVAVDLVGAPLAIAEKKRQELGLTNLRFEEADAEALPYGDARFDVVTCGWTFHQYTDPFRMLAEMHRVCRPDGVVAIDDMTSSEDPLKSVRHNYIERLRDPSHTRALPLSELVAMFGRLGLRIRLLETYEVVHNADEWLKHGRATAEAEREVRRLLEESVGADRDGLNTRREDGAIVFTYTVARIVAHKA
jgi:ubiquinone/menaquinone biosynthesis C-methylase UbiE